MGNRLQADHRDLPCVFALDASAIPHANGVSKQQTILKASAGTFFIGKGQNTSILCFEQKGVHRGFFYYAFLIGNGFFSHQGKAGGDLLLCQHHFAVELFLLLVGIETGGGKRIAEHRGIKIPFGQKCHGLGGSF